MAQWKKIQMNKLLSPQWVAVGEALVLTCSDEVCSIPNPPEPRQSITQHLSIQPPLKPNERSLHDTLNHKSTD